jgi:dienelactone hydrolase
MKHSNQDSAKPSPASGSHQSPRRRFLQRLGAGLSTTLLCERSIAADDSPKAAEPAAKALVGPRPPQTVINITNVGSLLPFIESQAVKSEFPLSYLQPRFKEVGAWKKEARGKFLEFLHYSPPPCEPKAEVIERVDKGDYIRETVHFNTTPDVRVPAFVLIPKNAKLPAPAIVALHDHGGFYLWGREKLVDNEDEHPVMTDFKKRFYGGRSIAADLARQGYVVIVIDMFYWGDRRMLLDDDADDWRLRPRDITAERIQAFNQRSGQGEQLVGRTIFAAGFTWPGVMFWDDVRTVDYLLTRPEVDKNRIGCVGLSIGGLRSCHLAALDDRIKAAVVVGWMASFPRQLKRHIRSAIGFTKLMPGLYKLLDYPDVAAFAMPSALLVINGSKDALFDLKGVHECFDKLAACYKKAGVPEKFRASLYDTPHEFNGEMQAEAWEWLRKFC